MLSKIRSIKIIDMKSFRKYGVGLAFISLVLSMMSCSTGPKEKKALCDDKLYEGVVFNMPHVKDPVFPEYSVSIVDYGAVGDGKVMNTEAFSKAIDDVSKKGGGKVIVPRGIWLTGPIELKSNINLHVESGALVLFSENKDLYPLVKTSFEGLNTFRCKSPLSGKNLENIAITGWSLHELQCLCMTV